MGAERRTDGGAEAVTGPSTVAARNLIVSGKSEV
jgi:hypothetical protein